MYIILYIYILYMFTIVHRWMMIHDGCMDRQTRQERKKERKKEINVCCAFILIHLYLARARRCRRAVRKAIAMMGSLMGSPSNPQMSGMDSLGTRPLRLPSWCAPWRSEIYDGSRGKPMAPVKTNGNDSLMISWCSVTCVTWLEVELA